MAGGACVTREVHDRGHAWAGAGGMHGWGHVWQGTCMAGACVAGEHAWQGGVRGQGACVAREKAISAGGTHPTGMHSCLENNSKPIFQSKLLQSIY